MRKLSSWLNEYFFAEDSGFAFSVCRFLFFISFWYYLFYIRNLDSSWYYSSLDLSVWKPVSLFRWFAGAPQVSAETLRFMDGALSVSMICAAFGLFSRIAFPLSFLLAFFLIGLPLNFGKVHHSLHMPIAVMGVMAFAVRAGPYSLDQWLFGRRWPQPNSSAEYRWPLRAIWLFMALTYLWAGAQKLRYGGWEWIFSENLAVVLLTRTKVTSIGLWVAQHDYLCYFLAASAVLIEHMAIVAFFSRRWRFLIWGCFLLHLGTRLLMGVDGGFEPWMLCFLFWVPWHRLESPVTTLLKRSTYGCLWPRRKGYGPSGSN